MNCSYGNVTCSCNDWIVGRTWSCAVCPAAKPSDQSRCAGNAQFECRYGQDTCICDGITWYCSTPVCIAPEPGSYPSPCVFPATYTCDFPVQDQICACGDAYTGAQCTCPAAMPAEGATCLGPVGGNGSGCVYGERMCDCLDGRWHCAVCPIHLPPRGSACSYVANCSYPTGFCYCDGTTWSCS